MRAQFTYPSSKSESVDLPAGIKLLCDYNNEDRFTRIACSPHGETLALPSRDGTIHMFDLDNRRANILYGHMAPVISIAFRSDAQLLASSSHDPEDNLIIWNRDSGSHFCLRGHANQCSTVDWLPNGTLVTGSYTDNTIRFWDIENRTCESLFCEGVSSVAHGFSGGRLIIAASTLNGKIVLFDGANGTSIKTLEGHTNALMVCFGQEVLVSCDKDHTIRIWDSKTGDGLRVLRNHTYHVLSVAYSPMSLWPPLLYSKSRDHTERLYTDNGREIARLQSRAIVADGWNCSGAWHPYFPRVPLLASITDGDRALRILEIDLELLLAQPCDQQMFQ